MASHEFPAPIGGIPQPNVDFAPSILFAILYTFLVPLMAYRMFHRRSRTILILGPLCFAIERIIIFSLRALMSRRDSARYSKGLLTYMQVSLAVGFLSRGNDMVNLLRCLLVNPTFSADMYFQSPASTTILKDGQTFDPPSPDMPDHPKARFWERKFCDLLGLVFIVPLVLGVIANSNYSQVMDKADHAQRTKKFRVISVAIGLVFFIVLFLATLWAKWKQPRTTTRGTIFLSTLCLPMFVICIYRLSVMGETLTAIDGPNPLNTGSAKALFYIFHVLPEFLFSIVTFAINVRTTVGTGAWGDWRSDDETEKEKEEREKEERKKAAKKAAKESKQAEQQGLMAAAGHTAEGPDDRSQA
ncbi:hypothetical protein BJ165DRAFT_1609218 [Panaeolus papilionaceus]|nr:hypothetical protein BJ165DRAFT_1609218 [Panaeolus papilionaceus]